MNPELPIVDGRGSFVAALQWGFQAAIAQDARRIVCSDPDFAVWPWDDAGLLQALAGWLRRPQRHLVLLARHYGEMPRRHPRFNTWRAPWGHAIEAWAPPAEAALEVPTLLSCDRSASVHLLDAQRWRGRCALDERQARVWCDEIDAVLQRSEPAFAVSTLGL
jgi:hypothetical protein